MNKNKGESFFCIIYLIFGIIFGISGTLMYKEIDYNREINGLWIRNYNLSEVNDIAKDYDSKGVWVCVNVKDMTYKDALETCKHEVGHEIFARYCELNGNFDKCVNLTENGK